MKEKTKKVLLWIILIWFAMVFIDSFWEAILFILFGSKDYIKSESTQHPITTIALLALSATIILKLQKKLNVSDLFKKIKKKK